MNIQLPARITKKQDFVLSTFYSIATFILLLKILSFLHPPYFPLINRVTLGDRFFYSTLTTNENLDSILTVSILAITLMLCIKKPGILKITFPILISITTIVLVYLEKIILIDYLSNILWAICTVLIIFPNSKLSKYLVGLTRKSVISGLLLLSIGIGILSLLRWISYPIIYSSMYSDNSWHFAQLEMQLHYLISTISPVIFLTLAVAIIIRIIIKPILKKSKPTKTIISVSKIQFRLFLIILFFLSVLIPIYPYLESLNPDFRMLGVDDNYYYGWINELIESNDPLKTAFIDIRLGDRPFSLLPIFSINIITGIQPEIIIPLLPIILTPSLLAITIFFIRRFTNDRISQLILGFMTLSSFQVTVGIYAGFHANWFALLTMLGSYLVTLLYFNEKKNWYIVLILILLVLTLLFHVYTWTFTIIVISIFIAISIFKNRKELRRLFPIIAVIGLTIMIDFFRSQFFGGISGVGEDINLVSSFVGIEQFAQRWENLTYLSHIMMGGFYSNVLILFLSLIWIIKVDLNKPLNRLLFSASVPLLIPILVSDFGIQSRILYNIPFFILAAIMTSQLFKNKELYYRLTGIFILIFQANYLLRAMSNLYFVDPT